MKKEVKFLLVVILIFASNIGWSQQQITGTVMDQDGERLPGVTVVVEGSTRGTVTNGDGNYSLTEVREDATLQFSFVGMKTEDVEVGRQTIINVTMVPDAVAIDEVVAIGYGTQKKSDVTGAVSSISAEDLKDYAASNVSQLITGKAAGVHVASSSGQPGQISVVRIRGLGTVNDNSPLYVVDGQFLDAINQLNPSDIENMEILKDASATAIYGSRGSNGVILITTKSGVKDTTIVSFDAYVGTKNHSKNVNMANSDQFFSFMNMAYENAALSISPLFEKQYQRGFDTNWWDAATQNALTQNYNLGIRSGGEKSKSYFSIGYLEDEGTVIKTDYSRISLKLNNEYELSEKITVGINMGLTKTDSHDTGTLYSFSWLVQADPFTPVINPLVDENDPNYEYNKYAPTEWAFNPNPVSLLNLNKRNNTSTNIFGNAHADFKISDWLRYYGQISYTNNNGFFESFLPIYHSTFSENNLANREGKYRDDTELTNVSSFTNNYIFEHRIDFSKVLNQHTFDALIGQTYEIARYRNLTGYKSKAPGNDEAFRVLDAATYGPQTSGAIIENSILSYLGRINYSYGGKYLATVSFRTDGSSRFAEGNRWGYFPSFSLGWRVEQENFFKNSGVSNLLSALKVRVGWGQVGNQRISNNAPVTLIGSSNNDKWYFGSDFSQGYFPKNIGNPEVQWETSEQLNIGIEGSLFYNRLTFVLDYYEKKTKDMLLQVPLPTITGFPNYPWFNAGNIENKGFEVALGYQNKVGDFSYSINSNISLYRNKVTSLGNGSNPLYGAASKTEVGEPLAQFFGYVWNGIFQNQDEIDNYTGENGQEIQPLALPGDFRFKDLDNNGVINQEDREYIGNPHPDVILGFDLNLQYKKFDFSAFFQGTIGNDIYNSMKNMAQPGLTNTLAEAYTRAWKEEGDINAKYPRISITNDNNNFRTSSWYIEDGSYIRLQNVQIGYNIPEGVLQKARLVNSCRIYFSGQNLLTFTKYSGLDPEIGSESPLNMGYDPIRYPSSRFLMFGINAQF